MRLLPRLSSKQRIWPGGPQLGEVVQAQLSPPAAGALGGQPAVPPVGPAPLADEPPVAEQADPAVALLLVLR